MFKDKIKIVLYIIVLKVIKYFLGNEYSFYLLCRLFVLFMLKKGVLFKMV